MRATALSASWQGTVSSVLGHTNVLAKALGSRSVRLEGLYSWAEMREAALAVAKESESEYIVTADTFQLNNDIASSILQGGAPEKTNSLWEIGIHGEGQVVGVADTGVDLNSCFFKDASNTQKIRLWRNNKLSNHRKVVQYYAHGGVGEAVGRGHGTHVAGSIAGNPIGFDNRHKGVAYKAKIAIFDIGINLAVPVMLEKRVFLSAYDSGARIHSNSWSAVRNKGRYTLYSQDIDSFMYNNQDFLVLFSSGNDGDEGKVVDAPATAKSCITVGASLSINSTEHTKLAEFSSRGPTRDGRLKPEIIAPGRWVTSASSARSGDSCKNVMKSGTSMATALLAGTAALVRQYFMDGYYPSGKPEVGHGLIPMAALIRAVIINSGERMTGTEAELNARNKFPNENQGFGLAKVDNVLVTPTTFKSGLRTLIHGAWSVGCNACPKIADGKEIKYRVVIAEETNGIPLRVTLAWSDYPSRLFAEQTLVEDLDLSMRVEGEDDSGHPTYPNGLNEPDQINTVERIIVEAPVPGQTYVFTVKGTKVTYGPQPYALVITGPLTIEDADGDGVPDDTDNCVNTPNSNQYDADRDRIGDRCDRKFNSGAGGGAEEGGDVALLAASMAAAAFFVVVGVAASSKVIRWRYSIMMRRGAGGDSMKISLATTPNPMILEEEGSN